MNEEQFENLLRRVRAIRQCRRPVDQMSDDEIQLELTLRQCGRADGELFSPDEIAAVRKAVSILEG